MPDDIDKSIGKGAAPVIRLDERFDLAVGDGGPAERQQASLLRAFFRQSIARRSAGGPLVQEVNVPPHHLALGAAGTREGDVALALAPLQPRENLIVFDAEALIERAGMATYALLSPASLDAVLQPRNGTAAARLTRVLALETALRSCRVVVAFDQRQARLLATLGAREVHVLPLPAMAPAPAAPGPYSGLLLVAHDVPEETATVLAAHVQVAARDMRITLTTAAERHAVSPAVLADATAASLHIHIGYTRSPSPPLRIIDSFAARKPVIHMAYGTAPVFTDDVARMQMTVEPFRTGFLAHNAEEVVAVLQQLRSDAAMREIFRRNLDHSVGVFNAAVEQKLWEVLA